MSENNQDLPTPLSFEGNSIAEVAVGVVEDYKSWIDWDRPIETVQKPIICASIILESAGLIDCVSEAMDYFKKCVETGTENYVEFYQGLYDLRTRTIKDRTSFILEPNIDKSRVQRGRLLHAYTLNAFCLLDFLINHKPCCRLLQIAWLIPAIGAGASVIPLVSYAAAELADLINDPADPYHADCIEVGNSWLHRLGIYLLHQCGAQGIPPDQYLIRTHVVGNPSALDKCKKW